MLLIATAQFAQADGNKFPCGRLGGDEATEFVVTEGAREYIYSLSMQQGDWHLKYVPAHDTRLLTGNVDSFGEANFSTEPAGVGCNGEPLETAPDAKTRAAGHCEYFSAIGSPAVNLDLYSIIEDIELGALSGYAIHYRSAGDNERLNLLVVSVRDCCVSFEAKIYVPGSAEAGEQELKSLLNALDFKICSTAAVEPAIPSLDEAIHSPPSTQKHSSPSLWEQLEGEFGAQ